MSPSAILGEAWRNILSGTARTAQLALILGLLGAVLIAADLSTITTLEAEARAYRASGASVTTLEAPGRVSPSACDAVGAAQAVRAGAIRPAAHELVVRKLPSTGIPTFEVTPGFVEVVVGRRVADESGVVVSRSLADLLGLTVGDSLDTRQGSPLVRAIYAYPDDGRRSGFGFAVLVPVTSADPFDECWADTWPARPQLTALLQSTLIPGEVSTDDRPRLGQLNSSLGSTFSGPRDFAERLTRFAPLLAGALALLVNLVATRARRIEFASARHVGVTPGAQFLIVLTESVGWVVGVAFIALPVAAFFVRTPGPVDAGALLSSASLTIAALIAFGLAGAGWGVGASREHRLFDYFRSRA